MKDGLGLVFNARIQHSLYGNTSGGKEKEAIVY